MHPELTKSIVRLGVWREVSYFGFPIALHADACHAFISPEERARSEQIKHVAARERFLGARCALRILLAGILDQPPSEVPLQVSTTGKPFVTGHPLRFSLSHAGKWGAIAIGDAREVGIDIEAPREFRFPEALDQRIPKVRGFSLLERWTLTEAALKSLELGVHAMDGLSILERSGDEVLFAHESRNARAVRIRFAPSLNCSAAVAMA